MMSQETGKFRLSGLSHTPETGMRYWLFFVAVPGRSSSRKGPRHTNFEGLPFN